jgi:hypothetical protein
MGKVGAASALLLNMVAVALNSRCIDDWKRCSLQMTAWFVHELHTTSLEIILTIDVFAESSRGKCLARDFTEYAELM